MSDNTKKLVFDIDTTINATGVKADVPVLPGVKGGIKADTGDVADVLNRLTNKLSSAIGMVYEPTHRVRMAKADAKVLAIKAQALVDLSEPEQRALQRFVQTESQKQENLESIIDQASPDIEADAKPEDVDDDFLFEWAERAGKVSDKEMQSLWARLLAGEINAPGSFRKSVLHTVSILEKEDANQFVALCRFVFNYGEPTPYVSDETHSIYSSNNI